MAEMKVGDRGWVVFYEEYPLQVEYLGHGVGEPDYPAKPPAYFRVLFGGHTWEKVWVGEIIELQRSYHDRDQIFYGTKAEAQAACADYIQQRIRIKEREILELRKELL